MRENITGKTVFGLFGTGGFSREVMPFVLECLPLLSQFSDASDYGIYFVETSPEKGEVNGFPVISEKDFYQLDVSERFFNIAIADSNIRERISVEAISNGCKALTIRSPNSIIYENNEVGEGAIMAAHTMVTANAKIGRFFHSNIYSYVAHDCVIGDFVTFSPGVHCNGNVHVEDHAYLGTGAILKQGSANKPLVIGKSSVIGMGAVVTNDIPAYTTVVGNPARPLKK